MELSALNSVGATESAFLANLTIEGEVLYHKVPQQTNGSRPLFEGTIPEFVAANVAEHPELVEQMRNISKKCQNPACGKSVATILPFCNGCDRDMSDAPEEYTENVCTGFMYGIRSASKFDLTLSLRLEEPDVLVYDDLLARSSCHLNAIPTDCHLPDWRHLLRNPEKGLALVRRLDDACWKVAKEQFWDNDSWRTSQFRKGAFSSAEDFRSQIYAGVNSVPSQFQIHLQYIVPPITPYDYHEFLYGKRLMKDRWLPLEYVITALEVLSRSTVGLIKDAHTMSMDDIFASIAKLGGPVYIDTYGQAIRRYNQTHRSCANWHPEYFQVLVIKRHPGLRAELFGAAADSASAEQIMKDELRPLLAGAECGSLTREQIEKKDKKAIQSYGRPYNAAGAPAARSYYRFAKFPGSVQSADDWAMAVAS